MTTHPTVLREVMAETYRKHAPLIEAIKAAIETHKVEVGKK